MARMLVLRKLTWLGFQILVWTWLLTGPWRAQQR